VLSPPRYRVEEHAPDLAAFIVGFADTETQARALLDGHALALTRARVAAALMIVDQDNDTVVFRCDVWLPSKS
jgi:hypothetical protein